MDIGHSIILPIWVGSRLRPVRLRFVGGDAELLPRMDIIEKLCISVDFSKRIAHVGLGERQAVTRNGGIDGYRRLPQLRAVIQIGRVFYKKLKIPI